MGKRYYDKVASIATEHFDKSYRSCLVKWRMETTHQKGSYTVLLCYEVTKPGVLDLEKGVIPFGFTMKELCELIPNDVTGSFELHDVLKDVLDRQANRRKELEKAIRKAGNAERCVQLFSGIESRDLFHDLAQDEAFIKMVLSTRNYHLLLHEKSSDD